MNRFLNSKIATCLAIVFVSLGVADVAKATVITPGPGTYPPDIFAFGSGPTAPTLLASTSTSWANSTGNMSGIVLAAVFSDPSNTFGAGDLDFVYQISNDAASTDSIGRVTAVNFTGFQTDVGYAINGGSLGAGFVTGTVAPELVDRNSADVVGFQFAAPLTLLIGPGQTSTVLVIETDASNFKAGDVNLIDGGATTVPAYEPAAAAVPEAASTMGLLALGLFGLFSFGGILGLWKVGKLRASC